MTGGSHPVAATALIADDEALARDRLADLLAGRAGIRVVGQCATGPATVEAVRRLRPDLLFLDVQMPGLDGFQVLARLQPEERPVVVFSTAYDEYAIAAFDVHAIDYLLKPFSDERFEDALDRASRALRNERLSDLDHRLRRLLEEVGVRPPVDGGADPAPGRRLDRLAVRAGERVSLVEADSVDWIEAAGDYVRLHVGGKRHLIRATLTALERRLDPARFLRVHRSAIVNLDRVRELEVADDGGYVALLVDGSRLRVGRRYRDAVLGRVGLRW